MLPLMPTALTDEDAFQEAGSHPRLRTGLREPPGLTAGQSSAAAQEGNLPVSPAPYKGPASSTAFLPPSSSSSPPTRADGTRCTHSSLPGPGWRRVEEEFPHIYAQGSVLRDVCSDCTGFVADVICSSRRSVAVLNAAPRRPAAPRSLRCSSWHE